jgi:hypothetical protein
MSHVRNDSLLKNEPVRIMDRRGSVKKVTLVNEEFAGGVLRAIVVAGPTGERRLFDRHDDGLFEDLPSKDGSRTFVINDVTEGIITRARP